MHKFYDFKSEKKSINWKNVLKLILLETILAASFVITYDLITPFKEDQGEIIHQKISRPGIAMPPAVNSIPFVLNNRTILLQGVIGSGMSQYVNNQILSLSNSKKPIYILIDSPGGDIMSGRQIIDTMRMSHVPIVCEVKGMAASMAAMILETGCTKRYMMPSAFIVFHQMSIQMPNMQIRETEAELNFVKKYWKETEDEVAKRLGLSTEQYYQKINNTWFITAKEAFENKYIDGLIDSYSCEQFLKNCPDIF